MRTTLPLIARDSRTHHLVRRCTPVIAVASLGALSACGDGFTGPNTVPVPARLQRAVDSIVAAYGAPGAIVSVRAKGGRSYRLTSGVADLDTKRGISASDHFRAASTTKAMVATLVLQLVDEKKIVLDAPIANYLPGIVNDANVVTVRQLLNHTAGVPSYTDDPEFIASLYTDPAHVWTTAELLAIANRLPREFAPGTPGKFAYSNTDYIVLGALVEKVTGSTVARALQTRIFNRLGMTQSSYGVTTTLPIPFVQGYADVSDAQQNVAVGTVLTPTWGAAAGAVVSTVGDLARFMEALASGELVSASSHAAQLQLVADVRFRFPDDSFDSGYGLGTIVGNGWVGHNGAIPGYETEAYAKPGVGSLVVMVNRTTGNDASHAIFAAVRAAEFGNR